MNTDLNSICNSREAIELLEDVRQSPLNENGTKIFVPCLNANKTGEADLIQISIGHTVSCPFRK
jgi:hypothetical protein